MITYKTTNWPTCQLYFGLRNENSVIKLSLIFFSEPMTRIAHFQRITTSTDG